MPQPIMLIIGNTYWCRKHRVKLLAYGPTMAEVDTGKEKLMVGKWELLG